jgi:hypothetical protein
MPGMRFVWLYAFAMGVPILGIVGVLHLGETLTPPVSVGGMWRIELSLPAAGDSACGSPFSHSEQPVLTISQSGPHLLLAFNDQAGTTLRGEIRGQTMAAESIGPGIIAGANGRGEETAPTHLEARVDRQAEPDRLSGVLGSAQCSSQTGIPFTAMRQPGTGQ